MGRDRDIYGKIAAELIHEGKALLARDKTRADEVEDWQKPALNVLRYLGADSYEAREKRHGGFLEWAGTALSEHARKQNVRVTLNALEAAIMEEQPLQTELTRAQPRDGDKEPQLDEAARLGLVAEAAEMLRVSLPSVIEWAGGGSYDPGNDTMALPYDMRGVTVDEFKAVAAHELQHKAQADSGPRVHAYLSARGSLPVLARDLMRPDDSLPLHLRATTMLAGVSAYAAFVLLGKTVGYQQELDADTASATVASADAAISRLRKEASGDKEDMVENSQGKTWLERVASNMSRALVDDHPSFEKRIDALRKHKENSVDAGALKRGEFR